MVGGQRFFSDELAIDDVRVCVGLISDTHLPERGPGLPPTLGKIFQTVDLILHAGDVGELWVLDQLSAIAPVVAVGGNDEPAVTARELPYRQLIACAPHRIVLCHSHFLDPAEERAWRQRQRVRGDWVTLCAGFGHAAGAGIVVSGHTHVPMVYQHDGVLLVNPGALAAPNTVSRQCLRTVALLYLARDGRVAVRHVEVDDPTRPFAPSWWIGHDWLEGARPLYPHFVDSIVESAFRAESAQIWERLQEAPADLRTAYQRALLHEAQRCWAGESPVLTRAGLLHRLHNGDDAPPRARDQLITWLRAGEAEQSREGVESPLRGEP